MADCCGRIWRLPTLGARCRTRILEAMVLKLKNGSIVHVFFSLQLSVLRSVYLWIKGCVKSRAFLLRRRARFPSPSERCATTHVPTNLHRSVVTYRWAESDLTNEVH